MTKLARDEVVTCDAANNVLHWAGIHNDDDGRPVGFPPGHGYRKVLDALSALDTEHRAALLEVDPHVGYLRPLVAAYEVYARHPDGRAWLIERSRMQDAEWRQGSR